MRGGGRIWSLHLAVLATIALTPISAAAADLSVEDLLGRWCGTITDYTFTSTRLTVKFHDGRQGKILGIKEMSATDEWIDVKWKPPYGGNTVFWKFSTDKRQMFQEANDAGDKGPEHEFHRC
jgi:hypothetical protein